jgi:hypothetical protein
VRLPPHKPLVNRIRVELDPAVLEEQRQPVPVPQGVADRFRQAGPARDPLQLGRQPGVQRLDGRLAALLPDRTPLLGRAAADLGLDRVELANPAQCLRGEW